MRLGGPVIGVGGVSFGSPILVIICLNPVAVSHEQLVKSQSLVHLGFDIRSGISSKQAP
jgi:hypothetical protein